MIGDFDRMDSKKCTSVCVCFILVLISMVHAMPNFEKQVTSLKCLRMGSTKFKLCIDDIDNFSEETGPSWKVEKKHWENDLTPRTSMSSTPYYNRRMFTDYGGMIVPFFMKKRSSHKSDVPFQSIFPFKMADSMESGSKTVNKRPFDSISYNAGLGGFK